ncbi:MAG TPA: DUF3617 family protein [Steroidobacteraceae bacterium]|nr:DUF3617 family protein [Steroidobacteraceae bacterium]
MNDTSTRFEAIAEPSACRRPPAFSWIWLIAAAALLTSPQVMAANSAGASGTLGLKPGLWQVELTYQSLNGRQVLDDQDLFARLLASVDPATLALDRANTALAQSGCANGGNSGNGSFALRMQTANSQNTGAMPNCTLPYAMRMQSEAAINESGANEGASSSYRICLTPALVRLDAPVLDAKASCRPKDVQHDGKRTSFSFSCGSSGTNLTGKGESHRTLLGHILTLTDFTATTNRNTHYAVHDRTEMKYLGAECGTVKPPAP